MTPVNSKSEDQRGQHEPNLIEDILQEEARYARGTRWLDGLMADLRFALRHFARNPGTTLTMAAVLAVGMSISTLLFSYVHSYAVQPPLGVTLEEDLVRIRGSQDAGEYGRSRRYFPEEEFLEYQELTDYFRAVAGWTRAMVALDAGDDPERRGLDASATFVTENYFSVLGVRPILGAGLPAGGSDDGAMAQVAVLGYNAWDQLFGRSPDVIGATISVSGVPVTIVGVAPERFIGMGAPVRFQVWMPLSARRPVLADASGVFGAAGRLQPGVSREEATAAAQVVAARAAVSPLASPGSESTSSAGEVPPRDPSTEVVPLLAANGDPMFERDVRLMSLLVGLLGLLVLLVTCTNVSALLTSLASARRQEIAIRLSLGAERTRLIRQLLTESALLASVAAAAALGIVWFVLEAVARNVPEFPMEMGITGAATIFTFGIALAIGVLFGLSPALHATRLALGSVLRDSSATIAATRARLQRGLVVAQVAFTQPLVVLLAAVFLLVIGNYQPQSTTEFADRLVRLDVRPSASTAGSIPDGMEARQHLRVTMSRLVDRLQGTPGVQAAVIDGGSVPVLEAYLVHPSDRAPGAPREAVSVSGRGAAEGYFAALGIPLVRGREFGPAEFGSSSDLAADAPVIVGSDLARRLWAGADPIGRRLQAARDTVHPARTLVVVGVIEESKEDGAAYPIYLPPDTSRVSNGLIVRTAGAAQPLIPAIRKVVQEEVPGWVVSARTVAAMEEEARRHFRLMAGGVSVAGLMALLLSAIGLYAVVAFSVGQRTREIAVRMAVGAQARQIVGRFVTEGLRLGILGLVLGLPVSLFAIRALMVQAEVHSVTLPPVTVIAALGVLLVTAAAAWIPARRAASVDPGVVLRRE